jgi:replication factor A2
MYVRVHGDLKSFNNRKSVNATSIKKVTDHNEVQYHLLEVAAVHLYHTRGPVSIYVV